MWMVANFSLLLTLFTWINLANWKRNQTSFLNHGKLYHRRRPFWLALLHSCAILPNQSPTTDSETDQSQLPVHFAKEIRYSLKNSPRDTPQTLDLCRRILKLTEESTFFGLNKLFYWIFLNQYNCIRSTARAGQGDVENVVRISRDRDR